MNTRTMGVEWVNEVGRNGMVEVSCPGQFPVNTTYEFWDG